MDVVRGPFTANTTKNSILYITGAWFALSGHIASDQTTVIKSLAEVSAVTSLMQEDGAVGGVVDTGRSLG